MFKRCFHLSECMASAVESYVINLKFDKFFDIEATLQRNLSPLTCEALVSSLPKTGLGWTARQGNGYYMIQINIKRGTEKHTKLLEKGDIVYCPREDSILLVFDDDADLPGPVNKLGKINSDLEPIKNARRGINVTLSIKETK